MHGSLLPVLTRINNNVDLPEWCSILLLSFGNDRLVSKVNGKLHLLNWNDNEYIKNILSIFLFLKSLPVFVKAFDTKYTL